MVGVFSELTFWQVDFLEVDLIVSNIKSMWFVFLFSISRFLIVKLATDLISIKNSLSAEIRQGPML